MAREMRTPDDFRQVADDAEDAVQKLREIADAIEKEKMPGILVHGGGAINHHLPRFWDWAASLFSEFESQAKAFRAGQEPKASYDRRRYRESSLEPPPKKKPAEKKTAKKKRK